MAIQKVGVAGCGLMGTGLVVWLQKATPPGTFEPARVTEDGGDMPPPQDTLGSKITIADVTPSSLPDVVFNGGGGVEVWRPNEAMPGTFLAPTGIAVSFSAPEVIDLDGDGLLDIALIVSGIPQWAPQNGLDPGTFLAPRELLMGHPGGYCLARGELGGDSATDLAVGTDSSGASVLAQTSNTITQGAVIEGADATAQTLDLVVTRLNADGRDDLVGTHLISLQCDGQPGVFTTPAAAPPWTTELLGLAAGDFDDDGTTDLAIVPSSGGQLRVYLQQ
jgi:hypothetical protein